MLVKVKITETLERIVSVEAQDKNEGLVKVATAYTKGGYELNENDFVGFKIERYEEK